MLVYGDAVRRLDPRAELAAIRAGLAAAADGPARTGLFVRAGELAQGLADAAFAAQGCDRPTPAQDHALALLRALAAEADWRAPAAALAAGPLPAAVAVKRAEGFAHYALYPDAYRRAAARAGVRFDLVIGLRSIGTALGAMVAAGSGARRLVTVRPVGPPFARRLALDPDFAQELQRAERIAIVDEGPGLSGSSILAVVEALGVVPERLDVFVGHGGGPGPATSPIGRAMWRMLRCHVADPLTADAAAAWVAPLIGPPVAPLRDVSGGLWRAVTGQAVPADRRRERRKILVTTRSGRWLVKFAGLGAAGHAAAAVAGTLARAGIGPQVAGLRHGLMVTAWADRPGRPGVADLARYLALRAREFPAPEEPGADRAALLRMAEVNLTEALGAAAAGRLLAPWRTPPPAGPRVRIDGRLHPWEWRALSDGRVLKTDGEQHHADHGLVGCQDIAWDVAGATVEFALDRAAAGTLRRAVALLSGRPVAHDRVAFCTLMYRAYQLGAVTLAAAVEDDPAERARLAAEADRYLLGISAGSGKVSA